MIEFEKVNQKGEKLKAYTHKGYLTAHYQAEVQRLQSRNRTWVRTSILGTTIASYWAFNTFQQLNKFVTNKIHWKGRFFIVAGLVGLLDGLFVSSILSSSLRNHHTSLLRNETFPAWYKREKVVNPNRVFFELQDSRNNEPNIYHSGITHSAIQNLVPDFIVGDAHKPHLPVAQHHHH